MTSPDRPQDASHRTAGAPLSSAEPGGVDDVAALERELAAGDEGRLARYAGRIGTVVRLLALLAAATGVVALALGLWAAAGSLGWSVVVVVLCLPGIVAPLYVGRRTTALVDAAAHPRELLDQARDVVGRVRTSPDLRQLAARVTGRSRTDVVRRGRLRSALGTARIASRVIGLAELDPDRHRLLVPFGPERLRNTWLAAVVSLWAWPLAGVVAAVSVVVLVVGAL